MLTKSAYEPNVPALLMMHGAVFLFSVLFLIRPSICLDPANILLIPLQEICVAEY